MLEAHAHDTDYERRCDHQISVLRLDYESSGQKLSIADVDLIMCVKIFIEEASELPQIPSSFICHLWQPDIFPNGNIMTFDIFEEQPDIHEQIDVVCIFDFIILLCIYNEYFVFGVLSW